MVTIIVRPCCKNPTPLGQSQFQWGLDNVLFGTSLWRQYDAIHIGGAVLLLWLVWLSSTILFCFF